MSGSTRIGNARVAAATAFDHVRRAAARMKPYASSAQAAAGRGVHKGRAFAAPRVERAGQAVEDSVAPKVSAMLSSAAQRLEPVKPRRRRWRKLAGISLLTAAAGAVAAAFRSRAKPDPTAPAETETDGAAPPAEIGAEEEAGTSTGADADGQVRTP
jgi:hypothetical protein